MRLVVSDIRHTPSIDFDGILVSRGPLFELLAISRALHAVREVWVGVDEPNWAIDIGGTHRRWFVYGFLCKSPDSCFKWDLSTWFPMVV